MSPLDRESLLYKIGKIRSGLRILRRFAKLSYREYSRDIEHTMTTERLLQVGVEAMLDIGNHIIATEGLQAPLEYRDVFRILHREKILPGKLVKHCQIMVGLRNRLVHEYTEIDHQKIHAFLRNDLGDFETYVKAILAYVQRSKTSL